MSMSPLFHVIAKASIILVLGMLLPSCGSKTIVVDDLPITIIGNNGSGLGHPEGIAFTPSGDFIAVANAGINTISFYKRRDSTYETSPSFILQNPQSQLSYPHDVSFSPDEKYLAVANGANSSITIYKKSSIHSFYDEAPIAVIKGEASTVPHAVKFAPIGNTFAVANVWGNSIALYHYHEDKYDQSPYQVIINPVDILNRPDGLAFSSDGELLAVTSHGNHSVVLYQRIPHSQGLYSPEPIEILQGEETHFCFTHSVSFHPSNDYLAVSSAGGKKTLSIFKKVSNQFPRYSTFPEQTLEIYNPDALHLRDQFPEEGGVKGIAFSPDGKQISLCASDIANPDRTILIYSIKVIRK